MRDQICSKPLTDERQIYAQILKLLDAGVPRREISPTLIRSAPIDLDALDNVTKNYLKQ